MTVIDVKYSPGTQKAPQQTEISIPCFTDTDHIHFPEGRLSTIPPYSTVVFSSTNVTLLGAIRSQWAAKLTGTYVGTYYLFGSNTRLYAGFNNNLYNITPLQTSSTAIANSLATNYISCGNDPIATTNGSGVITVTATAHRLATGDSVTLAGAATVNAITDVQINTTFTATVLTANTFTVSTAGTANATGSGGGASVIVKTPIIIVTAAAHAQSNGDRVKLSGAATTGGIPDTEINAEHIIRNKDTNTFDIVATTKATSSVSGGGGASTVYFKQIAAGNLDQGAAIGFGVGIYGDGIYGQGGAAVAAQNFPRIWSFGSFGNEIVMCPGDYITGDGQKIYIWNGNLAVAPTVLTNAPTDCNWVGVVNNSVVALCGRTVKISKQGDGTVWSGITYYEKTLERVWKLISIHNVQDRDAVIFTPTDAIFLRYVGGGDLWDLSDLYTEDGILSPLSACLVNGVLCWRGARGFYSFDGGSPVKREVNTQNEEWIIINTNYGKSWKSFAYPDTDNNQFIHQFPTGVDTEPGDYVIHNRDGGHWTLGEMSRTSVQRPGFIDSQFLLTNATSASVAGTIYKHFTIGAVTFNWFAETAYFYAGDGSKRYKIDQIIPDSNQSGDFSLIFYSRNYPQGSENTSSTYTVAQSTEYLSVKISGRLIKQRLSGSAFYETGSWKANIRMLGGR